MATGDTNPPRVLSASPSDGQTGVVSDAQLVITFTTLKRISASLFTPSQMVFVLLNSTPSGPSGVTPIACTDAGDVGYIVSLAFAAVERLFVGFQVPAPPAGTPDASSNAALAIRSLGTFATSATVTNPSIDAKATLQQAFTGSEHQVMFRLAFGALPSTNSLAHFTCNGFALEWVYLVS